MKKVANAPGRNAELKNKENAGLMSKINDITDTGSGLSTFFFHFSSCVLICLA